LQDTIFYLYLCHEKYYIMELMIENTKAQMRKGILEFCILNILDNGEAYPSDIIDALKSVKLIVVEGTLYPLLTRLKNAELLTYRWEESKSGPPRKYYSITPLGKEFLKELVTTWEELALAVNETKKLKSKK
jgi:PadR family transcriptional regulator, regulatory protein PadR